MLKFFSGITHTKTAKVVAGALVLASLLSFQGLVNADIGSGDRTLVVIAFKGNPNNDVRISGATVKINGGPDNGLRGTTNGSGMVTFNVHEGDFVVTISHKDYYTQDFPFRMDVGFAELDAPMIKKTGSSNPTPSPSPTPTPNPSPTPPSSNPCTPTPPSGRPLLNIWPISTSGAACTDYPLLSVKNVTQGTGWMNGTSINASAGDTLRVEMYVHNGTVDAPENTARNVRVKSTISGNRISGEAWADNADNITSAEKGGNMTVNMPSGATLSYVSGSTTLYDRNLSNGRGIGDGIVNGGVSVGDMRGCFEFLKLVTFDLKVNAPTPPPPPVIPPTQPPPTGPCIATVSGLVFIDHNGNGRFDGTDERRANSTVFLHDANDRRVTSTSTNSQGFYSFSNVIAGNYWVKHSVPSGYEKTTDDNINFNVCPNFKHDFGFKPKVVVSQPGTLDITKNVRNVSRGESSFANVTTASPGEQVEFQMRVTAKNGSVSNVTFTDTLPNRLNYVANSLTIDGSANNSNINSVDLGNLNSGQTKTVVIRATVANSSQFVVGTTPLINTAIAKSGNNQDTAFATVNVVVNPTITPVTNITINKTVRNLTQNTSYQESVSANPGDQVQFQIQVTANGNTSAQNVTVTDTLPSGMTLSSGSTSFNLGTMNAGSSQTVNLTANVSSSNFCGTNTQINTAQATSSNANTVSDTATVSVQGTSCGGGGSASLVLFKEVRNISTGTGYNPSVTASPNQTVQFRLSVTNHGSISANNVRITDFLPSGLTYITGSFTSDSSVSHGSLFSGGQFIGNLNPGQTKVLHFQATVNSNLSNQTLVNTATASADNTNSVTASASVFVSSIAGGNVDLVLSKRAFNQTQNRDATSVVANPGDVIVYTLSVRNNGNASATNYVFIDDITDILQLSQLQSFGDSTFHLSTHTLQWPQVTIPAGSTIEKTFTVKVNASFPVNSDRIMTNIFGNTVNVHVKSPIIKGVFKAPPTGSTTTVALALSIAAVLGYGIYKRYQLKWQKQLQELSQ